MAPFLIPTSNTQRRGKHLLPKKCSEARKCYRSEEIARHFVAIKFSVKKIEFLFSKWLFESIEKGVHYIPPKQTFISISPTHLVQTIEMFRIFDWIFEGIKKKFRNDTISATELSLSQQQYWLKSSKISIHLVLLLRFLFVNETRQMIFHWCGDRFWFERLLLCKNVFFYR